MFTAAVIVFREVFEIAIILSIILAATREVARRGWWINLGIGAGIASVGVIALFAKEIVALATNLGQHVFHAVILLTAAALISWSVIWMQQHGRQMTTQMRDLTTSIKAGNTPLYMLAVVIGLAVMREGSEIVLFLYGIFATGEATIVDLLSGTVLGTAAGLILGLIMYLGLMRLPVKQLFSISGWLLALLAAGMVAKATGHLVKADLLPALMNPLWDTSSILSQKSVIGRFLSIVIGYQDHPAGIQVLFYAITLGLISLTILPKRQKITLTAVK